jgi:hypothetical protein
MAKLYWKIKHWFTGCPSYFVLKQEGAWNPEYITPRYTCLKCGRRLTRGKQYPPRPWPKTPIPDYLKCGTSCSPERCKDCSLSRTETELKSLIEVLKKDEKL